MRVRLGFSSTDIIRLRVILPNPSSLDVLRLASYSAIYSKLLFNNRYFVSVKAVFISHKSINFLKRVKDGVFIHGGISGNIDLITNILAIQKQLAIVSVFDIDLSHIIKVLIHNYFLVTSVKISLAISYIL